LSAFIDIEAAKAGIVAPLSPHTSIARLAPKVCLRCSWATREYGLKRPRKESQKE
jgi:hypothetical protein